MYELQEGSDINFVVSVKLCTACTTMVICIILTPAIAICYFLLCFSNAELNAVENVHLTLGCDPKSRNLTVTFSWMVSMHM